MAASSDDRGNERAGGGDAEQEERTDGWMATYADMVTLLLTFFVLMFALSNVDNEKAQLFLLAMSRDGITAEQFLEIQNRYNLEDFTGGEWDDHFPAPADGWDNVGDEGDEGDEEGLSEAEQKLYDLANAIQGWIEDTGLGAEISIVFSGDFLMLTLSNDVWFNSGRADVLPDQREHAKVIGELLAANFTFDEPFDIIVAGHTDNVPQQTAQFPSNWHLSTARAQNFMQLLMDYSHLSPVYFYIRGFGEFRPIAPNDTPDGRQKNRRVEIMITLAREDLSLNSPSRTD